MKCLILYFRIYCYHLNVCYNRLMTSIGEERAVFFLLSFSSNVAVSVRRMGASERLRHIIVTLLLFSIIYFAGNENMHSSLDVFEFRPHPTTDYGISYP